MSNLLQDGAAWLADRLIDHAGVSIAYQRGASSVAITATASMHRYDVVDTEGFGITALSRDYLVRAADLVIGGDEVVPRSGDRVTETIRGVSQTFEVMAIGQLKEFEPVDTDGTLLKIHTKKIG